MRGPGRAEGGVMNPGAKESVRSRPRLHEASTSREPFLVAHLAGYPPYPGDHLPAASLTLTLVQPRNDLPAAVSGPAAFFLAIRLLACCGEKGLREEGPNGLRPTAATTEWYRRGRGGVEEGYGRTHPHLAVACHRHEGQG